MRKLIRKSPIGFEKYTLSIFFWAFNQTAHVMRDGAIFEIFGNLIVVEVNPGREAE